MKAMIKAMKVLKVSRNCWMLALSGSMEGMTKNNSSKPVVIAGIRKTPQNLDM